MTQNKKLILDPNHNKKRLYCGKSNILPDGYDDFGDSFTCLQKGFGAGVASTQDNNKQILTVSEIHSIANILSIPLNTKRGKKSTKTLIKNIIKVLNNL